MAIIGLDSAGVEMAKAPSAEGYSQRLIGCILGVRRTTVQDLPARCQGQYRRPSAGD